MTEPSDKERAQYEAIMAALEAQCPFEPDECMSECFDDTEDNEAVCVKCGVSVRLSIRCGK